MHLSRPDLPRRHLPILSIAAALLCFALPAFAEPAAKLVPAQSEIVFVTKQMGVPVEGRFKRFDAQIAFDPKNPDTGSVSFAIDTTSATLGIPETDAELPKPTWLGVGKFPAASFRSTSLKGLGGGRFEVAGKLTIKGMARELTVPVTLTQASGTSVATGSFAVKRLEFNIGEGEWADTSMIANDVQVRFKLTLTGLGSL
ncbi:YceI family protein [soil metagenome]